MTRRIAEFLMGERIPGEVGYYKRVNRIRKILNGIIIDVILSTFVAIFIVYLLLFG